MGPRGMSSSSIENLLVATPTWTQYWEGTRALLMQLAEEGYLVSKKKAQISLLGN